MSMPHECSTNCLPGYLTTAEYARRHGFNQQAVLNMIAAGRLPATKYRHLWLIPESAQPRAAKRVPA